MKQKINFQIEQLVFLKTDPEQNERIIVGITISKFDVSYTLAFGTEISDHYDFEITSDKDTLKTVK
jgi:hypothetical protein